MESGALGESKAAPRSDPPPRSDWVGLGLTSAGGRYQWLTLGLVGAAVSQVGILAMRGGPLKSWAATLGLIASLGIVGLAAVLPAARVRLGWAIAEIGQRLGRWAWLGWLGLASLLPIAVLGGAGRMFEPVAVRAVTLWLAALAGATLLISAWRGRGFEFRLAASLLVGGGGYLASTYLPGISSYPLSLGWSEASRYYYASLFASESVYGVQVPPTVLHPSRYLLQAIPFLLPKASLWVHRVWSVLLWLGLPLATASLLVKRLKLTDRTLRLLIGLWVVLFLFQGPILFHLHVPIILVLAGFRAERPWRSLGVVLLASAWAGISRINWVAVPGFLAATLYFLERPRKDQSLSRYWGGPVLWVAAGSAAALLAYSGYILLSGNEPEQFGSSLTSDLFVYRLLPNPTFPLGILAATGLASWPLLRVGWRWWTGDRPRPAPDRWLPVAAMLGVLLGGGVVVSLKIGGGSNLHNLDAYWILLLVVGIYLALGRAGRTGPAPPRLSWADHAWLLGVPLFFVLSTGAPAPRLDHRLAAEVVRGLEGQVAALEAPEPQVLFISERQLLTFREIESLELIPEYEKVFLMEMAISGTRSYLDGFHQQLREQRFDLIVSEPLSVHFQGRTRAFGEENDAWVREVSLPVLCYYEPVVTVSEAFVQFLAPRLEPDPCESLP